MQHPQKLRWNLRMPTWKIKTSTQTIPNHQLLASSRLVQKNSRMIPIPPLKFDNPFLTLRIYIDLSWKRTGLPSPFTACSDPRWPNSTAKVWPSPCTRCTRQQWFPVSNPKMWTTSIPQMILHANLNSLSLLKMSREQWPQPWLFAVYRGVYCPNFLGSFWQDNTGVPLKQSLHWNVIRILNVAQIHIAITSRISVEKVGSFESFVSKMVVLNQFQLAGPREQIRLPLFFSSEVPSNG